jgi:hypothetical protein
MPLGISGTFNFMIVFQAEHNILISLSCDCVSSVFLSGDSSFVLVVVLFL